MNVRPRPDTRDDAELVLAATAGERGAFAAIYDRYADRLHDFCWSLLRDRDEAADATQDAFVVAAERLGQLRDPERLRPWLYAVARSQAIRRIRARSRVAPEEELTGLPDPASGPEQAAERSDLRELVWNAAAGLSERDRSLLNLHLRHGLEGAELGEAVGVAPGHAHVLLSRLRDQVERSLGALLVASQGRPDCPALTRVLAGWDGRFSPLVRKRVARHVDACPTCGAARQRLASPVALLAAVPPLPAPTLLRRRVLERIQLTAGPGDPSTPDGDRPGSRPGDQPGPRDQPGPGDQPGRGDHAGPGGDQVGPAAGGPGRPAGRPGVREPGPRMADPPEGEPSGPDGSAAAAVHSPLTGPGGSAAAAVHSPLTGPKAGPAGNGGAPGPATARDRRRGRIVALAAALLLAIGVGVGLGWERSPASSTDGQGGPIVAGAVTSVLPSSVPPTSAASTSSSTSATTGTTATTAPPAPPSLAVTPARVDLGATGTRATLTLRNGGDRPLSWTAAPSRPWLRASPSSGRLDGGEQARISLSAARAGLPEGATAGRVELAWGGPARSVAVTMRVEHAPEIGGLSATPPEIFAGPCGSVTSRAEATVTDESPLSSVTLRWGGRPPVPMIQRNGTWFAGIGPVQTPGTIAWQVVATDERGNQATASGPAISVLACP